METAEQASLEARVAQILVEALRLEDVDPATIDPEAPLVGGQLGLDSIDLLELAMAIQREFGVRAEADEAQNRQIFASVRALAQFVAEGQAAEGS